MKNTAIKNVFWGLVFLLSPLARVRRNRCCISLSLQMEHQMALLLGLPP
jgi:hypothetical protein